ncbi:hypothetical protein [Streptomyces sp. A012304]|uniref:hypothetical protein n=1 Tax=Streptomyces sp. A012304 TaxID=375446 RepID=UPI0022327F4B|nr:hypothetical protein [Streptomyces sp. A012304]GKQ35165.1 hypothetical protein ALMP_17110 [Streptomyces sp. A012304]
MGLFSRKSRNDDGMSDADMHRMIREDQQRREQTAEAAARDAAARETKWSRIVQGHTRRGEDDSRRDYAIRQHQQAKTDRAAAETEMLKAKSILSDYRRR